MSRADPSELVVWSDSGQTDQDELVTRQLGFYALLLAVGTYLAWRVLSLRGSRSSRIHSQEPPESPVAPPVEAVDPAGEPEPADVSKHESYFKRLEELRKLKFQLDSDLLADTPGGGRAPKDAGAPEPTAQSDGDQPAARAVPPELPAVAPLDKAVDEALDGDTGYAIHSCLTVRRHRHPKTQAALGFALHLHASDSSEKVKGDDLLPRLAEILAHGPDLEIELCVNPPDTTGGEPAAEAALLKDTAYDKHVVRDIPANVASLYGKASPPEKSLSAADLQQMLDIVQVDHLRLSAATIPAGPKQAAPLLPVGKADLFRAGNHVYRPTKHQLATLEIGPWIPVDARGHFALHKWHVGRIVLLYRPPDKVRSMLGKRRADIVPDLLWDASFGFVEMMQGEAATNIILLTPVEEGIQHFRKRVSKLRKADGGKAADARFDMLKRRMFYSIQPRHGGTRSAVLPVWSGQGEPLHRHDPECTCADVDEMDDDQEVDPLSAAFAAEREAEADVDEADSANSDAPPKRWKGKAKDEPAPEPARRSKDENPPKQRRRWRIGEPSSSKWQHAPSLSRVREAADGDRARGKVAARKSKRQTGKGK